MLRGSHFELEVTTAGKYHSTGKFIFNAREFERLFCNEFLRLIDP
ncbi:MAG: hypothetical protein NWR64_08485 [Haliea sp.]|nr:hypothetical protein [Haliea sp.]